VESGCRDVQVELRVELDRYDATEELRAGLNDHGHGVQAGLKGLMDTTGMRGMTGTLGSTSNRRDMSSWDHKPVLFGWLRLEMSRPDHYHRLTLRFALYCFELRMER
jgi:hypothetical protein